MGSAFLVTCSTCVTVFLSVNHGLAAFILHITPHRLKYVRSSNLIDVRSKFPSLVRLFCNTSLLRVLIIMKAFEELHDPIICDYRTIRILPSVQDYG